MPISSHEFVDSAGSMLAIKLRSGYRETRAAVSRKDGLQVDATTRERQPCTKLNRTR